MLLLVAYCHLLWPRPRSSTHAILGINFKKRACLIRRQTLQWYLLTYAVSTWQNLSLRQVLLKSVETQSTFFEGGGIDINSSENLADWCPSCSPASSFSVCHPWSFQHIPPTQDNSNRFSLNAVNMPATRTKKGFVRVYLTISCIFILT